MTLEQRVKLIEELFDRMNGQNASSWQIGLVKQFREAYPELGSDLDYCFEVLAGMHKIGFTLHLSYTRFYTARYESMKTIEEVVEAIKAETANDKTELTLHHVIGSIKQDQYMFFSKLLNRSYKLGYSNKNNMVTDKHCMLAKSYPEGVKRSNMYYIQEKLNGNRCIAYFDAEEGIWKYTSRSQKPMNVDFDMSGMDPAYIYDGEIMTKNKMGNKDFAETSGAINSKYGDKSNLVYFIYDILDDDATYAERYITLMELKKTCETDNVKILKVLDLLTISPNADENVELDKWLDVITSKGGEGVMLRQVDAPYHHSTSSGNRKDFLLKYKKTKTADLRIVGWNEGKGKYEGAIGSFICEDDAHTITVNVAGMTDDIRWSNPDDWMGKIIEVAYFEGSKSKNKPRGSLQFPRMKGIRHDKTETSLF